MIKKKWSSSDVLSCQHFGGRSYKLPKLQERRAPFFTHIYKKERFGKLFRYPAHVTLLVEQSLNRLAY
jgi:hypothetical protein